MELLPRGNVCEFEVGLLRTVIEKRNHHDYMNEKYPATTMFADTPSDVAYRLGMAAAELSAAVNVLAWYTDRRPDDLHAVSDNFRELEKVIRQGRSWKKQNEAETAAALKKYEEENKI